MGVFSGMRGWGLPWLLLGLASNVFGPGADPPIRIQADAPLTRTLNPGEVHRYSLPLDSGDYARLEVVQQGLDVAVVVREPWGSGPVEVDTPTGRFSTETLSLVAEQKGDYEVEVRASFPADSGRYSLALGARRVADAADRLRVEAERADLKAGEGIEAANRALEVWRALGDRRYEARARTWLGRALGASGRYEEALAAFGQALSLQRELNDREGMATTLSQTGRTLRLTGDGRRALQALEESLALWRELGRPDLAAAALVNIGTVHQSFGDAEAALGAFERNLELSRETGDRSLEAMALNALGLVRFWAGRPHQALDDYRKALDLARSTGRARLEAEALSGMGSLYQKLGMPRDALEHHAAAREIFHTLKDTDAEAVALNNLGTLLFQLGALENARELLGRALPLQRDPRNQAMTLVSLSRIAEEMGETGEAASHIEEALKLQRKAKHRAGEAESLRAQGLLLLRLGDPAGAEAKLAESLSIYEELRRRSGAAASRRGLAGAYAAQGKLDEARKAYEESLAEVEALGDVGAQTLILAEQGRLEHEDGKLPAARERLEAALELMESFRSEVGGDRLRSLHFATVRETYERYVDVLMRLGLDERAFEVAEQSRARGLLDVLARAEVDTREGDPRQMERELRLRQELNAKAALRLELGDDEASRARKEALRAEIDELVTDHALAEAQLTDGSLKKPSIGVREIQSLLDEQTVLMEYLLGERRSYLWVVSPTSLKSFELPGRKEIEELARRLHEHLRHAGERDVSGQNTDRQSLSRMVLGPALDAIAGRQRLVIVPDGALQYVPFAALPVAARTAASKGAAVVPLVVEHELVVLPSAAVLQEIRRAGAGRPQRPPSIAVVADPAYDGSEPERRPAVELDARGPGLERLAYTRQEAEGIRAAAQGRDLLFRSFLGHDATRELVTSGRLEPFQTLHFATHGILDSEHPELSALALSQRDAKGQPLDPLLSLQDLYSLRLQADLVVLSGCETGLGRELRGEGLVGLTHGFLHAGASQVVASLWQVRDRASAELMQSFYTSMLRDGLRPAAALRAAQIEMMDKRAWRDPYYWAAFVAQGDWTASRQ